MITLAKTAAIAGSLASAAAIAVAVVLPTHHATPAGASASGLTAGATATTTGGSSAGSGQPIPADATAGGSQSGIGGAGKSSGSAAGGSTGSHTGAGSGTSTGGGAGSTGKGSTGIGTVHPIIPGLPHTPIPIVTAIPSPTGTIGDAGLPCLQGYVWRQAYSGDYVCVTAGTRSQAAADNAAAVSRVQQGGGAYGQYTCIQGFVWRQVVPDDYTCVAPAVRAQAAYDNSQAGNRVALLSLWVSDWTPPAQPPSQNCSGGVCTTTEGGWSGPNFQINGDLFNFGPVLLQVRSNSGAVLWSTFVTATSYTGFPGAALYAQTPIGDCSSVPGTTDNDYVIALDMSSGRWSNQLPINSDCASL